MSATAVCMHDQSPTPQCTVLAKGLNRAGQVVVVVVRGHGWCGPYFRRVRQVLTWEEGWGGARAGPGGAGARGMPPCCTRRVSRRRAGTRTTTCVLCCTPAVCHRPHSPGLALTPAHTQLPHCQRCAPAHPPGPTRTHRAQVSPLAPSLDRALPPHVLLAVGAGGGGADLEGWGGMRQG